MRVAPIPGFGTGLELHRRDVGAGQNEMALDVAHGEGGHRRVSFSTKKKPRLAKRGAKVQGVVSVST
jgi:hypothetical protein